VNRPPGPPGGSRAGGSRTAPPGALHRFFVEPGDLAGDVVELDGPLAHQVARVLRLRDGDRVVLLDGSGREGEVELVAVTPSRVRGVVRETRVSGGEPRLAVALYQALVPREKLELVIQKGTEVGVSAFVPVACERSLVRRGDGPDAGRLERWGRIAREAAEQSRRGRVPEVRAPLRFPDALAEATAAGPTLVAWEGERARPARTALRELLGAPPAGRERGRLSLFVGPEGGFAPSEIQAARERGAATISLGPRILRTETAGPILAALALYEAGDLEPACPE
jgi:16S rRNA (uracil1498-N3)-methyltransferase